MNFKKIFTLSSLALFGAMASAKITIETYNPGEKSIFAVTSAIILGDKEAILVDAQFQKNDAEAVVQKIKDSGRDLTTVFISHSDPDYYFGLDVIQKNFPKVKILATPQVAYLIDASKNTKVEVWKEALASNAPQQVITPNPIHEKYLELEGTKIEIKQDVNDPDHAYLWIPELKTVLGGIPVTTGEHIWLADSQKDKAIETWIAKIDQIKALNPSKVIPGHSLYTGEKFSAPEGLNEVKTYLDRALRAKSKSKNSQQFIHSMERYYPNLAGKSSLEMSGKVLMGETPWETLASYPAIGKKLAVKFGDLSFELNFVDNKTMSFQGTGKNNKNSKDTVQYTAVEVAPNVYMVYWSEPKQGSRVVHIQDYNKNIVYTNIATKNGQFLNLKGTFELNP